MSFKQKQVPPAIESFTLTNLLFIKSVLTSKYNGNSSKGGFNYGASIQLS